MDKTYNGWTNYETWRVNLEMVDGFDPRDHDWEDKYDLAEFLKDHCEELICMTAPEGLARDYALAFLSAVNWQEIAQHLIDAYCTA